MATKKTPAARYNKTVREVSSLNKQLTKIQTQIKKKKLLAAALKKKLTVSVKAKIVKPKTVKAKNYNRDHSKYKVNNSIPVGKGQAALKIVQTYMSNHQDQVTAAKLETVFPAELATNRRSFGVVARLNQALKENKKGKMRYFTKTNQIVKTMDGVKYAVSNQWNRDNFKLLLDRASELGITVIKVS